MDARETEAVGARRTKMRIPIDELGCHVQYLLDQWTVHAPIIWILFEKVVTDQR